MRRQPIILAAFFALFLATFAPIRAQESTSTDENAGIMTLASGDLAYTRISDLIRGEVGSSYYSLSSETSSTNAAELYTYILKDVADDSTGDVWLFSGSLLAYGRKTSSQSPIWFQLSLCGTLYKLTNGNWALKSSNVGFGLPGNMTSFSNTYGVTYDEGATFFEQYVAAARRYCELLGTTFNEATYANYINYATWDTDEGGVNNLAEWVRGTRIDYWRDDAPSDSKCKCGACCSCECKCGQWSGAECGKTSNDCACHPKEPDCTCADYCCACECKCEKCADGMHSAHQNGSDTCDGTIGDTIGFVGCDCHKTTEEKECECAKYCCKHTCKCEKCGDGEHSAHKNDNGSCDGTFENCSDCHEEENPDDEECTCANYCCYHTCACPVHKDKSASEHSQHGNNSPTCDGTTGSGGCDCHETTDDEECTCANYCCACKCECKKCKAAGSCSGNHKNGDMKCDGVSSGSTYVCDCHASGNPENPEETPCTCGNYCCACKCECKKCKAAGSCSGNHKNGGMKCAGVASGAPGGSTYCCSCHQDDFPEGDVPTAARNEKFIENSEFDEHYRRLSDALEQKFGFSIFQKNYGSFQGDAKLPTFQTPRIFDRTGVTIDLNKAAENKTLAMLRGILVAMLWFLTFARIFNSLREVFG